MGRAWVISIAVHLVIAFAILWQFRDALPQAVVHLRGTSLYVLAEEERSAARPVAKLKQPFPALAPSRTEEMAGQKPEAAPLAAAARSEASGAKAIPADLLRIRAKVESSLGRALAREGRPSPGKLALELALHPDGSVESARVGTSSGVGRLDELALQALYDAAPFGPLPSLASTGSGPVKIQLPIEVRVSGR